MCRLSLNILLGERTESPGWAVLHDLGYRSLRLKIRRGEYNWGGFRLLKGICAFKQGEKGKVLKDTLTLSHGSIGR